MVVVSRTVAGGAAVCRNGLLKTFFAGLPLTAVMIIAAAALSSQTFNLSRSEW